jgi:hypothetical protein
VILRRIKRNEVLPRFYGIAWAEDYANRYACLPVPLNLVASVIRYCYLALLYPGPIAADPRDAYRQGWRDRVDRDEVVADMREHLAEAERLLREVANEETVEPEPGSLVERIDAWLWSESMRRIRCERR